MFKGKFTFADGDIQFGKLKETNYDIDGAATRTCRAWFDNRTEKKLPPDGATVYPFAIDDTHVIVVCPYCRQVHRHGNSKGDYEGWRVSHCREQGDGSGGCYYIKKIETQ
jgi:hypothetical protein